MLDRGYDDYVEGKIPEALWLRKSREWESDVASIEAAIQRQRQPIRGYEVEGGKILELAKRPDFFTTRRVQPNSDACS